MARALALLPLLPFLPTQSAFAQSPNTSSVVVVVSDQSGAIVPGAQVTIINSETGFSRDAITGGDGSTTIAALPVVGRYSITVSKPGFTTETVQNIVVRAAETASVRVRLTASGGTSDVTVYGTVSGVRADPELGQRLDAQQIEQVPLLGRKISALPLLNAAFRSAKGTGDLFLNSVYFVTGAGGRREADFVVDGASGDEPWGRQTMFSTIPVSAVQEMTVMSRAFSSEFGWTSSAAVNVVTKAGTNETHGEALFLGRPGRLQPTTFSSGDQSVAPPDIPDAVAQGSFAIGGAFVKDRTQYFVAGDGTWQERTASITSPLSPAASFVGNYRQALVDARIDHAITASNALMARFNLDRFYDTNPQDAVSGNVLPSAGRQFTRHAYSGQVNETAVVSSSMLNEARFEFQNADPVTAFDPLAPSTQLTRAGSAPFTAGESRFAHVFSRVTNLSDTLSWTRNRHYVRLGGSVGRNTSGGDGTEFGSAFALGQFTLNATSTRSLDQLTIADVQRYQQSFNFGAGTYELSQWIVNVFAQDSFRVRDDVTLDLGLRYDRQTFSDGTTNFAPRLGFGWNPAGDAKTSVRGGYGLYYTMLRANTDATFELGGPLGIFTYTATAGQTGFPTCLSCTPVAFDQNAARSTLPARNITIRPGMASFYSQFFDVSKLPGYDSATFVNPKSQVASIGFEREIAPRLFFSADYVKQHWTDLDRTVDLNAPSLFVRTAPGQVRSTAAADATRPIVPVNGGFRQINVVENLGVADYDGLQTMIRWQSERAFVSVSYTLSKATNTTEPNGNAAGPNDFNQLGEEERGPSILDQRHRGVVTAAYRFPMNFSAGTMTSLASARPYNATTGVDNNGDGVNNDRPVIDGAVAARYSFRGTPIDDVALFAEERLAIASGRSITLRLEAFNVLNRGNILGRNGTYGDTAAPLATFGSALGGLANVDPARMIQFQVRFNF
ncbi:MAG TPA: TonB-dependent receptor [Vicinamibacterales bacterium]|nr:TonB-dependent receptor [Vicinamibacterales bacterium]